MNPPRGGKNFVNFWAAGDNTRDQVFAHDFTVVDSQYYNGNECSEDESRIYWESRNGEIFNDVLNGGPGITKMEDWTPREEFKNSFIWDGCSDIEVPQIDCSDFPEQEIGSTLVRTNVNVDPITGENRTLYEQVYGSCWPEEGFDPTPEDEKL